MKPTLPAPDTVNPLFEGLKQLVRQAVREELQNSLIARNGKPEKLLFDTEEAAQFLNVPPTWLASMAREQKIKSIKLGHYVRFARTDLEAFIQAKSGIGKELGAT